MCTSNGSRSLSTAIVMAVIFTNLHLQGCLAQNNEEYGIEALLRISYRAPNLLPVPAGANSKDAFEVYRNTQVAILQSRVVLQAALQVEGVSELSVIQSLGSKDTVEWLRRLLNVEVVGESELVRIQLAGIPDASEAEALLNAVVDAYLVETVTKERIESSERLDELQKLHKKLGQSLDKKAERYFALRKALSSDGEPSGRLELMANEFNDSLAFRSSLTQELLRSQLNKDSAPRVKLFQKPTIYKLN